MKGNIGIAEQRLDWNTDMCYDALTYLCVGTVMYIACLCPNFFSVHFNAVPIFLKILFPVSHHLFYNNYIVYNIFNMTMHYPQWNYRTVQSFVFTNAIVSEVCLLKWKKKDKKKKWLMLSHAANFNPS